MRNLRMLVLFSLIVVSVGAMADTVTTAPVVTPSTWEGPLGTVVQIFGAAIGAVITGLVSYVLALIAKKYNVTLNAATVDYVRGAADIAVQKVEQWAAQQANVPTNNDKLNQALQIVKSLAATDIVKQFTDEQLVHFIESSVFGLPPTNAEKKV